MENQERRPDTESPFPRQIGKRARRKLRGRRRRQDSVWHSLGTFGVVGWSIAIPTLLGVLLGTWLDRVWPVPFSWTLTLLLTGLVLGVMNAWRWIERERLEMEREREEAGRDDDKRE